MELHVFCHKEVAYLLAIFTIGRLHTYLYDYLVWSWRVHEYCYTLNAGFVEFNWERRER